MDKKYRNATIVLAIICFILIISLVFCLLKINDNNNLKCVKDKELISEVTALDYGEKLYAKVLYALTGEDYKINNRNLSNSFDGIYIVDDYIMLDNDGNLIEEDNDIYKKYYFSPNFYEEFNRIFSDNISIEDVFANSLVKRDDKYYLNYGDNNCSINDINLEVKEILENKLVFNVSFKITKNNDTKDYNKEFILIYDGNRYLVDSFSAPTLSGEIIEIK